MFLAAALFLVGSAAGTAAVLTPRDAAETTTKVPPPKNAGGVKNGSPGFHPEDPGHGPVMSYDFVDHEDEAQGETQALPREDLWEKMANPVFRELSYTYTTCAAGQYGPLGGYSPCYACPSVRAAPIQSFSFSPLPLPP